MSIHANQAYKLAKELLNNKKLMENSLNLGLEMGLIHDDGRGISKYEGLEVLAIVYMLKQKNITIKENALKFYELAENIYIKYQDLFEYLFVYYYGCISDSNVIQTFLDDVTLENTYARNTKNMTKYFQNGEMRPFSIMGY